VPAEGNWSVLSGVALVATSKVEFAHVTAVHDADASGGAPQQQPQRMFSGCSTGQGYYSSGEGNVRTSAVVCFSEARTQSLDPRQIGWLSVPL
jgi:hypothetical protein